MAYYGKLNWIEVAFNGKVKTIYNPTDTTKWKGNVAYSSKNKADGKWHKCGATQGTKTLQSGNTYGNTPTITQTVYRQYSKKKTIGGKKNRQYYRQKKVIVIKGFLSSISDSAYSGASSLNKDSYKYFCNGFPHTNTGKGTIPKPTSFEYSYEDIDTEKVDGKTQLSSLDRNKKGYIKRNRVRKNVVTINIGWSHLTASEAKILMEALSGTQYLKVQFKDPSTNTARTLVMFNNARGVTAMPRGEYQDLYVTLIQV